MLCHFEEKRTLVRRQNLPKLPEIIQSNAIFFSTIMTIDIHFEIKQKHIRLTQINKRSHIVVRKGI